ncbi:MAG: redoxin domain-containing protein [Proteobacteria bacterium]|nr:redoxin domain-containing protein [Pseudomonadota bacterium]
MFNRTNLLIVAVALLGAALGLVASAHFNDLFAPPIPPGVKVLHVGDARLDVSLTDTDGKPHRLSEFDGQLVLLNFWATWCSPCREEMPLLDATHAQWANRGLRVIGVAMDDGDAVRDFLRASPVRYPILLAGDADDLALRYGNTRSVLPYSVLLGRDGHILAQHAGNFSEKSLKTWLQPYL